MREPARETSRAGFYLPAKLAEIVALLRDMMLFDRYELESATTQALAEIFLDPLHDPTTSRIKS